jgi:hypothetical protein
MATLAASNNTKTLIFPADLQESIRGLLGRRG